MLRICLVFWKSDPQYAHKKHVFKQERQRDKSVK